MSAAIPKSGMMVVATYEFAQPSPKGAASSRAPGKGHADDRLCFSEADPEDL